MNNIKNNKYTLNYLNNNIVILKNNEMYRIGDVFKISKYNQISNHKLCTAILNNEKYDNTILKIYLLELVNPKYNNKLDVLINVINEYRLVNKIKHYDENFLVLHLRSGDAYKRFGIGSIDILNTINTNIKTYLQQYSTIKYIVIVTAMHYGHTNYQGLYKKGDSYPTKYIYTDKNYNENIKHIYDFICNQTLPVIIESSDIDKDFVTLCTCKYLITSGGEFSKLTRRINSIYNS